MCKAIKYVGFHDISVGKEFTCNAWNPGSIPGSGRSTGERIGYPLQYSLGFPCDSADKETTCNVGNWVWSLSWEDPLEQGKATYSNILAWRIPWTSPWGCKESDTTEWLSVWGRDVWVIIEEVYKGGLWVLMKFLLLIWMMITLFEKISGCTYVYTFLYVY